jgi:hypothetical protein
MDRGIRKALEGKRVAELTAGDSSSPSGEGKNKNSDDVAAAR